MAMPRHKHDCDACQFLGVWDDKDRYDLYVCGQDKVANTVIARWGSEGSEYVSGLIARESSYVLREAWLRAQLEGWRLPAYWEKTT